jgi:acetate kinase
VDAVGHRIVHGGRFRESVRVTPEVKAEIERLASFAPEHNCREVEGIEAAEQLFGAEVPHVAVFDTAFHASMPEEASIYAGPYEWIGQGIRRYGFHGISHQYVARRAAELLDRPLESLRLVTCHLGNGCSLAAVRDGRSVDTTMGFTPLEGLMMGTRSGSVDPGVLIHLMRHCGHSADDLDRVLNRESGLKGISGVSSDMRDIERAMREGNPRARLAFEVFVHRLCAGIGAMTASAGGVDAIVFTGGIGENSQAVRSAAVERLAWLGLAIGRNVLVVPTQEEREIARETAAVLQFR